MDFTCTRKIEVRPPGSIVLDITRRYETERSHTRATRMLYARYTYIYNDRCNPPRLCDTAVAGHKRKYRTNDVINLFPTALKCISRLSSSEVTCNFNCASAFLALSGIFASIPLSFRANKNGKGYAQPCRLSDARSTNCENVISAKDHREIAVARFIVCLIIDAI